MKRPISIFPVGHDSDRGISQHPHLSQEEPDFSANCYVGDNLIVLPVYNVSKMIFEAFKEFPEVAFYAFERKTPKSKRYYFYSQNLDKVSVKNQSVIAKKLAKMIASYEKEKSKKDKKENA